MAVDGAPDARPARLRGGDRRRLTDTSGVRITCEIGGGFIGGPAGTVTVDTAHLEATAAQNLESLVRDACLTR